MNFASETDHQTIRLLKKRIIPYELPSVSGEKVQAVTCWNPETENVLSL